MSEPNPTRSDNKKVTSSVHDVAEEKPAFGSRYYGCLRFAWASLKFHGLQVSNGRRRCMEPECLGSCPTSRRSTRKNHRIIIETTFETCTSGRKRKIQFKTCKTLVLFISLFYLYCDSQLKTKFLKKTPLFRDNFYKMNASNFFRDRKWYDGL